MYRKRIEHTLGWLLPVLLFLLVLCGVLGGLRRAERTDAYLGDGAYANLVAAKNLAQGKGYGLRPDEPGLCLRDVLWRYLVSRITRPEKSTWGASTLLATACSIITVVVVVAWARRLTPAFSVQLYTGLLLILSPGLVYFALSGLSQPLGTALVMGACFVHVRQLAVGRRGLPISAMLLVAFAAWVRLEFILVWVVFGIHAGVLGIWRRRPTGTTSSPLWPAFLGGIVVVAVMLVPILGRNTQLLGVGWPRVPGTPMPVDAWIHAPLEAARTSFWLTARALPDAFGLLRDAPYAQPPLARVMMWVGALALGLHSLFKERERAFLLPVFLVLLMPVLVALAYPYFGWHSASMLIDTLGPAFILLAVYGTFQLATAQKLIADRLHVRLPGWTLHIVPSLVAVALFVTSATSTVEHMTTEASRATRKAVLYADLGTRLGKLAMPLKRCATDEPGRLVYEHGVDVVDLTGEFSPGVLAGVDKEGTLGGEYFEAYLAEQKPDLFVLWDRALVSLDPGVPVKDLVPARRAYHEGLPRVFRVVWPAGP